MVLQLLAALVGAIFVLHGDSPNAARHTAHHGVLGVHAIAEKETQIGREVVNVHPACQIGFDKRETVGQGERQLADRVCARFSNVITADGHGVEISHIVVDEKLGDISKKYHKLMDEQAIFLATLAAFSFLLAKSLACSSINLWYFLEISPKAL